MSIYKKLFLATIILGVASSWGVSYATKHYTENQLLRHAQENNEKVSTLLIDYIDTMLVLDNREKLQKSMESFTATATNLFSIEIFGPENSNTLYWRSDKAVAEEYLLEIQHDYSYASNIKYRLKLIWSFEGLIKNSSDEMLKKQTVVFFITLAPFCLLLMLIHLIVMRPLRNIHNRLSDVTNGNILPATEMQYSSFEFHDLNKSLNHFFAFSQDLQSRERTVRAVIDASLDCIIIADEQGQITEFNPAAEKTFGFKQGDVVGQLLTETIIPEEYREAHKEGMKVYLKHGLAKIIGQRIEVLALHATGYIFPVELVIEAFDGPSGKVFIAYLRDITDRKNDQDRLEDQIQKAETANAAKSEFLAMMSHEIRTPLNGVIGVLGLLDDSRLSKEQQGFVHTGRSSAETLLNVINDVLDFSKMEAGKLELEAEVFDVHALLGTVEEIIRPRGSARKIDLFIEIAADVPQWVEGDSGRIRQVLINLAGNAIKFTKDGHIRILLELAGDKFLFSIEDTGIGIPKDKHGELFTEFAMLDSSYSRKFGGTGLGLAISRNLAELMGGTLGFESEEGKGSLFFLEMPLVAVDAPKDDDEKSHAPKELNINFSGQRILVAEDNPANVIVIKAILERLGLVVDVANDGNEVVEAVRSFPYDLIFMDIAMPEMDGIEATKAIRALPNSPNRNNPSTIPIVAMTAHAMRGYRQKVINAGMDDYLKKPINRNLLLETLNHFLEVNTQVESKKLQNVKNQQLVKSGEDTLRWNGHLLIDDAILLKLERDIDSETIQSLVELFLSDSEMRMKRISDAIDVGDHQIIEDGAHTLGSSSAAYGAIALHKCLRIIEAAFQANDTEKALSYAQQSIELYHNSVDGMKNYLETRKN